MRTWLKEKRENKKYTQTSFAKEIEISLQHYNYIENGKRRPTPEVAQKIADVLEFDWTLFYKTV